MMAARATLRGVCRGRCGMLSGLALSWRSMREAKLYGQGLCMSLAYERARVIWERANDNSQAVTVDVGE